MKLPQHLPTSLPCLHHGLRTMVPGLLITDMAAVAGHTPMSVEVPKMSLAPRIFQFRPSHIPDTQPEGEENQHVNLANLSNRCFFSSLSFCISSFSSNQKKTLQSGYTQSRPLPGSPVASRFQITRTSAQNSEAPGLYHDSSKIGSIGYSSLYPKKHGSKDGSNTALKKDSKKDVTLQNDCSMMFFHLPGEIMKFQSFPSNRFILKGFEKFCTKNQRHLELP